MIMQRSIYGSLALAICLTGLAAAQEIDGLLRQTVMLTVTHEDGSVEHGSGVVLCQVDRKVYVLTAHHVLAGRSEKRWHKKTLRLRKLEEVEISFQGGSPEPVLKDALKVTTVQGEDLLVIEFPLEAKLAPAKIDAPPPVDDETPQEDRPVVTAVGFFRDEGQPWAHRQGTLVPGGAKFIHHTGQVAPGFSGGPLFSEAGTLIGINIERVAGEAIGAEVGASYGAALSLEAVLPKITNSAPAQCLKSAKPLSELANDTYRQAMREISIKRWKRAASLMEQAVAQQPNEGGTVHLEGLRYTPYLPRYHHGLALYKVAKRTKSSYEAAELYGAAIREWERSEAQGQIQSNKRYRKMSRLLRSGYKELRRHSTPRTEEEKAKWAAAAERASEARALRAKAAADEAEAHAAQLAAEAQAAAEEAKLAEAEREAEIEAAAARALAQARAEEEERRRKAAEAAARAALRQVIAAALPCARVRAEPAFTGRRIDCLPPGSRVTLLEARGGWSQVRLEGEQVGWVASQLLEPVPDGG